MLGLVVAALLGGVVAYFVERHKAEARAAELNEAKNALTVAQKAVWMKKRRTGTLNS